MQERHQLSTGKILPYQPPRYIKVFFDLPAGFGNYHLGAQLVKLLPQRMHLKLNLHPTHLWGLVNPQRASV